MWARLANQSPLAKQTGSALSMTQAKIISPLSKTDTEEEKFFFHWDDKTRMATSNQKWTSCPICTYENRSKLKYREAGDKESLTSMESVISSHAWTRDLQVLEWHRSTQCCFITEHWWEKKEEKKKSRSQPDHYVELAHSRHVCMGFLRAPQLLPHPSNIQVRRTACLHGPGLSVCLSVSECVHTHACTRTLRGGCPVQGWFPPRTLSCLDRLQSATHDPEPE